MYACCPKRKFQRFRHFRYSANSAKSPFPIRKVKDIRWLNHIFCDSEALALQAHRYDEVEVADGNNNYQEFQEPLVALGLNK